MMRPTSPYRGVGPMPDPDVHALAGAYALDALPYDEARFFETHLDFCAACREEVAELRQTAARLGSTAAEHAPPRLRERVIAEIDLTRQLRAVGPPERPEPRWNRLGGLLGIAAAVMVIVTIGLAALVASLSARVEELEARSGQVYQVLAAEDARSIALGGAGVSPARPDSPDAPSASVVVSEQKGQAVLVAEKLPRLGDDRVYEFWLVGPDGPRPAGLFRPDERGQAVQVVAADLSGVQAVGVTIEPRGGSPTPTSDLLLFGEISRVE